MNQIYHDFTRKYKISKTLRFELIPQGKTLENIESHGILTEDEHLAESYFKVKKMIDEYHKIFIDQSLRDLQLDFDKLQCYFELFDKQVRNEEEKERFRNVQDELRKQIADCFQDKKRPSYKTYQKLFKKELIKELLPAYFKREEEQKLLLEFENFTSYFTGFCDIRKNLYTKEIKSNSVSFRLIHENLPRFIQNMKVFALIKDSDVRSEFSQLERGLKEVLPNCSVNEAFSLEYFNCVLTQEGITNYNLLLNGYSKEDGEKIKGLNEYINLYNQQSDKAMRLPKLQSLYKQILSDYESISFIPDKFESDEEVLQAIHNFYHAIKPMFVTLHVSDKKKTMRQLLMELERYDLDRIYVNSNSITELSRRLFGDWKAINCAFYAWYDLNYKGLRKVGTKAYDLERDKYFKGQDSFSIAFLNTCCKSFEKTSHRSIVQHYVSYCDSKDRPFFAEIEERYVDMELCLNNYSGNQKRLAKNKRAISCIKAFLDYIKEVQWELKPLLGKGTENNRDEQFYGEFLPMYEVLDEITLLYNRVRNFLTCKPYSTEKIKLNFGNSSLLNGWSVSKESTNASVILKKDDAYYLGIMGKGFGRLFEEELPADGAVYQKMEYKLLPDANMMLPKVFFSKKGLEKYQPSEEILRIYKNRTFKKGKTFSLEDCHKLIEFFKASIQNHEEWSKFGFVFSDTASYEDISGFYREVEAQGYLLTFRDISCNYIDKLVEEGKFYLFQIYNKDFSAYSKGTPNLHTLYFKALFSPENMQDVVYKLNGQAEIFYRKKSITKEDMIMHSANEPVMNKNPLNPKKESIFTYPLYKDKRYTMDKFQFHVPITMNFKAVGLGRLNQDVNAILKQTKDVYVIGINRGERHLLYISVIDPSGKIVEQYSLNEIVNEYRGITHRVDYEALLAKKADVRDFARKNWDTIENIKELKEGYLSQAIHKITQLMIKYHAIVVMEDLNFGFIQGRQAIEKQIYQKFVKMLIDKLNYHVDKKLDVCELGGLYHAYQLTNKFESFQKLGKQSGFLFFAPAWNISNMDPTTGFVNLLYPKYENLNSAKDFFGRFDTIYYDATADYFCFAFDYSNFTDKAEGTRTKWTLCSFGDRVRISFDEKRTKKEFECVYPTKILKSLFHRYGIVYDSGDKDRLKEQILHQTEKAFFVELYEALRLILQMRNHQKDADYLISPVMNSYGEFFDSREAIEGLPDNIEANGAYNIARKGLLMLDKIRNSEEERLERENLAISHQEWLQYAQNYICYK